MRSKVVAYYRVSTHKQGASGLEPMLRRLRSHGTLPQVTANSSPSISRLSPPGATRWKIGPSSKRLSLAASALAQRLLSPALIAWHVRSTLRLSCTAPASTSSLAITRSRTG